MSRGQSTPLARCGGQGKGLASSLKCFLAFCLVYAVRTKILFSLCLIQPTDFER